MKKGKLFIVSGPSGAGKDTVLTQLFKIMPDINLSKSYITRPKRPGDDQKPKYCFISKEEFLQKLEAGEFLEYNEYVGNYYGTPKTPIIESIESGKDIVLEIDINGAHKVKSQMPEAIGIFIAPPSFAVLKERLTGRSSESEEQVKNRLRQAVEEIKHAEEYDFVVVNDQGKADECASRISDIILGKYSDTADSNTIKTNLIKEVIKDVESVNW